MSKTFNLLINDHKKVKALLKEILSTSSSDKAKRTEMFATLKHELQAHEKIEERYVYPPLEEKKPTHDKTEEAYEEHHVVDLLLKELDKLDVTKDEWIAKLTVLEENLIHHIKEEEKDLFIKAKKVLSQNTLDQIEESIETAKEQAPKT